MSKSLIRGLVASVVAAFAMVGLTACNSSCCGCGAGPAVYKKPCCAGQTTTAPCGGCGKGSMMTVTPAPAAPAMPAPMAPAGGAKACGAGKCG